MPTGKGINSLFSFYCDLYFDSDSLDIVTYLSHHKNGFLFTSQELIQILDLIPSKRTQILIIEMIGPRLVDPKKYSNQLLDRFRYAEEKKIVQDILKARAVTQNSNIYASKKPNIGRNPIQRRPNRPNSPTNPVTTPVKTPSVDILPPVIANPQTVVATPEKILLPSVEILPTVSANRSASPTHPVVATPATILPPSVEIISTVHPPPSLPEPHNPRIEPQENIRLPQDSENNKKSESSNFGDFDSVDFSPTTTNEDFENIIADKEDPQLSPLISSEQPPAKKIQETIPPVKGILESPVMVTEKKNDKISASQQHTVMTGVDDQFCFDSPVIEVVGNKTRVLSVHQSQPTSKIGSEVEFLTHTDEFSFDERFQDRKIDSNQSNPDPSSNYFLLLSIHFPFL